MLADTERREVARRLRHAWVNVPDRDPVRHHLRVLNEIYEAVGISDGEANAIGLFDRLADLIEPSCDRDTPQKAAEEMFGKMRHSTKEEADAYDAMLKSKSVEIHPVDRDALLELVEELEEDACWEIQTPGDTSGAWRLKDACDRIRDALGVSDGD